MFNMYYQSGNQVLVPKEVWNQLLKEIDGSLGDGTGADGSSWESAESSAYVGGQSGLQHLLRRRDARRAQSDHAGVKPVFEFSFRGKRTFGGVDGPVPHGGDQIVMPVWMMQNLDINPETDMGPDLLVQIRRVRVPKVSFLKLQPEDDEFVAEVGGDMDHAKLLLESRIQQFTAVSAGDTIPIISGTLSGKVHMVRVLDVSPAKAVSVNQCETKVEFAPSVASEIAMEAALTEILEELFEEAIIEGVTEEATCTLRSIAEEAAAVAAERQQARVAARASLEVEEEPPRGHIPHHP